LIVKSGSIISSIEYNKENDGIATKIKIIAGIKVQTISKIGACTTIRGCFKVSLLYKTILRPNI